MCDRRGEAYFVARDGKSLDDLVDVVVRRVGCAAMRIPVATAGVPSNRQTYRDQLP